MGLECGIYVPLKGYLGRKHQVAYFVTWGFACKVRCNAPRPLRNGSRMPHSTRFLNRILAARFRAFVPSSGRCAVKARGNPQRKGDERMRRKHAICAAGAATRVAFGPNDAHVPPSRKTGALGRSSFVLLRPFFYSGHHEYEQTKPLSCEFDAGARSTGWVRSCAPCATSPCGKSLFGQRL